jgi:hypothetical protein
VREAAIVAADGFVYLRGFTGGERPTTSFNNQL